MATARARSFHEAGHAVAATLTGRRVERVSIVGVGSLAGYTLSMPADSAPLMADVAAGIAARIASAPRAPTAGPPADVDTTLLRLLSGSVAEQIACDHENRIGASDDMEQARGMLGADSRPWGAVLWDIARAKRAAHEFVQENWSAIEAVALALQCNGTLTGAQVRLLIDNAPDRIAA